MAGASRQASLETPSAQAVTKRAVVWDRAALRGYIEIVRGREEAAVEQIRECVEQHLEALADDPSLGSALEIKPNVFLHRFKCMDGDVGVWFQIDVEVLSPEEVAVLVCGRIEF